MFRIAICDDEKEYLDIEQGYIDEYLTKLGIEHEICCFKSGSSFLKSVNKDNPYDLAFLDVEMKADNGMDIAKLLLEESPKTSYYTQNKPVGEISKSLSSRLKLYMDDNGIT